MGHSHHNADLLDDCRQKVDAIDLGDAYDMGFSGDRRGDAYMNTFQRVIANCPWFPASGTTRPTTATTTPTNIAWGG